MDSKNFIIGTVVAIAGAGAVYFFMSSKDTTPVGLVVRKSLNKGEVMGEDELGDMYRYAIVDGSFRLSESSLPLNSTEGQDSLLVVFINEIPSEARLVNAEDWNEEDHQELLEEYGIEEEEEEVETPTMEENPQVQNAESLLFGNLNVSSLQSNHWW
jgi:hypothetical protein|tara:strand:+ start:918 stop:1388 length:471 start_codon:yes stop_codon:yes gene_type:complete